MRTKRDLVKEFILFLESLNDRGKSKISIVYEDDEEISFQGEIPKKELGEFLNRIREKG